MKRSVQEKLRELGRTTKHLNEILEEYRLKGDASGLLVAALEGLLASYRKEVAEAVEKEL